MSNEKKRASIEAQYKGINESDQSVCSGQFYIKNKKVWESCKKCDKCDKYKYYKYKESDTKEVTHCYVDSFRNCELYKIDFVDGKYIARTSIYSILYANDVAINMVRLIGNYMPKEDKQAQKIYAGSMKRVRAYEHMVNDIMKNKVYDWADFNLEMDRIVEPIIDKLYQLCKTEFENKGYKYSDFYTCCQLSSTFVDFAVSFLIKRIENCRKFKVNAVHLRQYDLSDLRKNIFGLCDWTSRTFKGINLNQEDILKVFRAYNVFMIDHKAINKIIRETVDKKE